MPITVALPLKVILPLAAIDPYKLELPLKKKWLCRKKATQRPTAEKLLAAFKHLTLTLFRVKGEWYGDVTELNPLQNQILLCLRLSPDIYSGLVANST